MYEKNNKKDDEENENEKAEQSLDCDLENDETVRKMRRRKKAVLITWRMMVSVISWMARSSANQLIISHILLYRLMVDLCFTVDARARFAFRLPW